MEVPLNLRSDQSFVTTLPSRYLAALETHPQSVYGLWPDFTLAYLNPAWYDFASRDDELGVSRDCRVGDCVLDAVEENLRDWYCAFFTAAMADSGLIPKHHEYLRPTPQMLRWFVMMAYPVRELPRGGLIVVNSLRYEGTHDRTSHLRMPPRPSDYTGEFGFIRQCMHCRQFRSEVDRTAWDWIPEWIYHTQSNVTHSICPLCYAHYYSRTGGDIEKGLRLMGALRRPAARAAGPGAHSP
ncbi:MAG: hypothetical protein ABSC32_14860 [Steroidobacteraceae bacterium]